MKKVFITGGTRGIGRQIALDFAKAGYQVAVCYRKDEKAKDELLALAEKNNVFIEVYKADVSNEQEVEKMFACYFKKYKNIDVLINNAGVALIKMFQDTTFEEWNKIIATNLSSAFLCTKCVVDKMVELKKGLIINISSMWGEVGASCEVAYSVSKAGLDGFTKSLAKELGASNIRVNSISAGLIDTKMNSHLSKTELDEIVNEIPLQKIGNVNDISKLALFLAENDSYITGQILAVNGGFVI